MVWSIACFLSMTLALVLDQGSGLRLLNVRPTHGIFGPERSDHRVLPGDVYRIAFDIEGVHPDANGYVSHTMAVEVTNSEGKVIYSPGPKNLRAFNALGGTRMQGFTFFNVGLTQPPGEYTIRVTFTDRTTKAMQSLEQKFEVMPADFGLVGLGLFADADGRVQAPPQGVAGQPLTIVASAVGFARQAGGKQPDVIAEMQILDESGKATTAKQFTFEANQGVPQSASHLPFPFMIFLNRPGKFTIVLRATDRITKKAAKLAFPLSVSE
jgi:hypothetical protein